MVSGLVYRGGNADRSSAPNKSFVVMPYRWLGVSRAVVVVGEVSGKLSTHHNVSVGELLFLTGYW